MRHLVTALVLCGALAACGDKDDGTFEIRHDLKTNSTKVTGMPRAGQSFADATPRLDVTGVTGPIADGVRAALARDPLASKGAAAVDVELKPAPPPASRGRIEVTLHVVAKFAHPPDLSVIEATISGRVDYKGISPHRLGEALGTIVAERLANEKLPANIGVPAPPAGKAIRVAGGRTSCSLFADGSVWCWDDDGMAGPIPAAADSIAIDSAQNNGVCGVRRDGSAYCIDAWDNTVSREVRAVCGVENAKDVSVGQQTACALLADGRVKCWPGQPRAFAPCDKGTPAVEVKGVTGAVALHTGPFDGCAIGKAGEVMCWDHCDAGCKSGVQGQVDVAPTARVVKGLTNATAVATQFSACAINRDTHVTCVERSSKKRRDVTLPEPVKHVTSAMEICALGVSGQVYCWRGDDKPAALASPTDVVALDADIGDVCAITGKGHVLCWGGIADTPPERAKQIAF